MLKLGSIIAVGLGGGLGAILRLLLSRLFPVFFFGHFPAQIFLINVIGCFLMGMLVEIMSSYLSPHPILREFMTTGFLGGFTTFSAFTLEYALIIDRGLSMWALFYASATIICTISAFFIGLRMVKFFISI